MIRRMYTIGFLVILFAGTSQAVKPPNILWLTVEDMSPVLGCLGDPYAHTPHLDQLAKESVTYTRAFATAPVCSPARSCLITGVYAASLGTQHLRSEFPIPPAMTGFPALLREAGFYTSNNGKTDYNTSRIQAITRASWDACSNSAHWRRKASGQPFFSVFNDMVTHQTRTMVWTFDHFQEAVQGRLDPALIHRPEDVPVPPYYPDTPLVRKTLARFYDCVSVMDQQVGDRLQQLEEDGLAEDTIVFFYSDHGSGLPRHKRLLLDSGMHVPLMIRFPKKYQHLAPAAPGTRTGRLVSFVDFGPTVLSLLDMKPPETMQGIPFLGTYAGPEREYVYGARDRVDEAIDLARSVRDQRYLYIRNYMPHISYNQPSAFSDLGEIRDEITALARAGELSGPAWDYAGPTRAVEELYDTRKDPLNLYNLADSPDHQGILQRLRKAQAGWSQAIRDVGYLPEVDAWRLSRASTPYDMARRDGHYDLARIRDTAELVGRTDTAPEQMLRLRDPDPVVRYWAALGLRVRTPLESASGDALRQVLADPSPPVRMEAAGALLQQTGEVGALEVLVEALDHADENVVLHAARNLQLAGEKARPAIARIQAARRKAIQAGGTLNLFINFSTTMHLVSLGEIPEAEAFSSYR